MNLFPILFLLQGGGKSNVIHISLYFPTPDQVAFRFFFIPRVLKFYNLPSQSSLIKLVSLFIMEIHIHQFWNFSWNIWESSHSFSLFLKIMLVKYWASLITLLIVLHLSYFIVFCYILSGLPRFYLATFLIFKNVWLYFKSQELSCSLSVCF